MVDFQQSGFSPKEIRAFYLSLTGLIAVSFALFYGVGFIYEGHEDPVGRIRTLMHDSWWMVVAGVITFSAAYMVMALVSAIGKGSSQPVKPRLGAVFVLTLFFAALHSLRLAYGENFLYNFSVIFAKDLLGVALALLLTLGQPIRLRIYGTKERLGRFG